MTVSASRPPRLLRDPKERRRASIGSRTSTTSITGACDFSEGTVYGHGNERNGVRWRAARRYRWIVDASLRLDRSLPRRVRTALAGGAGRAPRRGEGADGVVHPELQPARRGRQPAVAGAPLDVRADVHLQPARWRI